MFKPKPIKPLEFHAPRLPGRHLDMNPPLTIIERRVRNVVVIAAIIAAGVYWFLHHR